MLIPHAVANQRKVRTSLQLKGGPESEQRKIVSEFGITLAVAMEQMVHMEKYGVCNVEVHPDRGIGHWPWTRN